MQVLKALGLQEGVLCLDNKGSKGSKGLGFKGVKGSNMF